MPHACCVRRAVVRGQRLAAADEGAFGGELVLKQHIAGGVIDPLHKGGAIVAKVGQAVRGAHAVHPIQVYRLRPPWYVRAMLRRLLQHICEVQNGLTASSQGTSSPSAFFKAWLSRWWCGIVMIMQDFNLCHRLERR